LFFSTTKTWLLPNIPASGRTNLGLDTRQRQIFLRPVGLLAGSEPPV
jgi:hypothetical protein